MLNFSSFWLNYFESCQRSWLEMARLWMPSLPTSFFGAGDSGTYSGSDFGTGFNANSGLFNGGQSGLQGLFSSGSWLSALTPWIPRVEANIEPFNPSGADASAAATGLAEAARISMRIFMPWGGEPFWVEALVGQHAPKSFAPQEHYKSITDSVVHEAAAHRSSKSV